MIPRRGGLPTLVNDATGYTSSLSKGNVLSCYLTQDAVYTESHDYYDNQNGTLLNVGAAGGAGSLTVTGEDTVVNVGGHLYVGGKGYYQAAGLPANSGYVFWEQEPR